MYQARFGYWEWSRKHEGPGPCPHKICRVVVKQIPNSYANDYFITKVISTVKEKYRGAIRIHDRESM